MFFAPLAHTRVRAAPIPILLLLVVPASWSASSNLRADDGGISVVSIEEDWELRVGEPDLASNSPQITCVLSPVGSVEGLHVVLELNHQSQPTYSPGGLQLQVWNGDEVLATSGSLDRHQLFTPNETATWTQRIAIQDGSLKCEVVNASSATWGDFSGPGHLKISLPTSLENLNNYRPTVSVQQSGVNFATHRVVQLTLKGFRARLSNGMVLEFNSDQVVYPRP